MRIPNALRRLREMLSKMQPEMPSKRHRLTALLLAIQPLRKLAPTLTDQLPRLIRLLQLILELLPTAAPTAPPTEMEKPTDPTTDPTEERVEMEESLKRVERGKMTVTRHDHSRTDS